MSLFGFFNKRNTSTVARDRLQILLAHERSAGAGDSDLITKLHQEILEVIKRHVAVDQDKVQIKLDGSSNGCSMLEIDIEVPQIEDDNANRRRSA
ncbi:cell division topological specificity factor MinE [Kozakia baliensis]|uniref:Cell division topological specificity factor n=1 Tax=Kozakia baliensis TaxID=153496 RepID=A0A1D8UUS7_9PROT|nr:cell division topological specificity factor MinE [Kozakia baliensis]AOX17404.1 cell division topological specificity factor [Kozakia baliensis]AOX20281.1 cell division topological specificity factor [Kozakia baliensis]GBR30368.1 cell division topological specificity factor MinE [Kozakia baliensis NRIC 0488]GEL63144.1 cell division topological specificity factor [Kozakia baliensis]